MPDIPTFAPLSSSPTQRYLPKPVTAEPPAPARRHHLAVLAAHLTTRDQWLLEMLHEHKVLTSHQIHALAFTGARTMRARLRHLTLDLRVLDRFRPRVPVGTAPEHYVLGPAGAAWLAAGRGVSIKEFGYHRSRAHQIAVSSQLGHAVGTNDFFVDLSAAARTDPDGGHLTAWWSERRCLRLWGDMARPDGYGRFVAAPRGGDQATARQVRFFLEYDTGTEALPRLAAKLSGYAQLAKATSRPQVVIFRLHSTAREAHLHEQLGRLRTNVPVATTTPAALAEHGPTGAAYRCLAMRCGPSTGERVRLIDLDALTPPIPRHTGDAAIARPAWWTEPPTPLPPTGRGPATGGTWAN